MTAPSSRTWPDYSLLTVDPSATDVVCPPRPPVRRSVTPSCEVPVVGADLEAVPLVRVDHPRIRSLDAYGQGRWQHLSAPCILRRPVAERLAAAAESLPGGFGLAVFDAYRTVELQAALYAFYYADGDLPPGFISPPSDDPARPAPHQTGGAVDVTLTWRTKALALGTDFDDMGPLADPCAFEDDPGLIRDLRRLLHHAMRDQDFEPYDMEWWHYEYGTRSWAHHRGGHPLFGAVDDADVAHLV